MHTLKDAAPALRHSLCVKKYQLSKYISTTVILATQSLERNMLWLTGSHVSKSWLPSLSFRFPASASKSTNPRNNRWKVKHEVFKSLSLCLFSLCAQCTIIPQTRCYCLCIVCSNKAAPWRCSCCSLSLLGETRGLKLELLASAFTQILASRVFNNSNKKIHFKDHYRQCAVLVFVFSNKT